MLPSLQLAAITDDTSRRCAAIVRADRPQKIRPAAQSPFYLCRLDLLEPGKTAWPLECSWSASKLSEPVSRTLSQAFCTQRAFHFHISQSSSRFSFKVYAFTLLKSTLLHSVAACFRTSSSSFTIPRTHIESYSTCALSQPRIAYRSGRQSRYEHYDLEDAHTTVLVYGMCIAQARAGQTLLMVGSTLM